MAVSNCELKPSIPSPDSGQNRNKIVSTEIFRNRKASTNLPSHIVCVGGGGTPGDFLWLEWEGHGDKMEKVGVGKKTRVDRSLPRGRRTGVQAH